MPSSTFTRIQQYLQIGDDPRWREPEFTNVVEVNERTLKSLGPDHRRRKWFTVPSSPKWGELETAEVYPEDDPALPITGPLLSVLIDGERHFQTFRFHPHGTYAALTNPAPARGRAKQPVRPASALNRFAMLNVRTDTSVERIRGAKDILAEMARRGTQVRLTPSRDALLGVGPSGRVIDAHVELIREAAPLLLPWVRDEKAATCTVSPHPKAVEAIDVVAGAPNQAWCGSCVPS